MFLPLPIFICPGTKGLKWEQLHSLLPLLSLRKTFASCPCDFSSLEALVPKEGMFPLGDTIISLNYDLRLPPGHFGLLCLKSIGD